MNFNIKIKRDDLPEELSLLRYEANRRHAGKMKDKREKRKSNKKRDWMREID